MILAVCGGKGGVGKSTVAANLGAELDAVVVEAGSGGRPDGGGPPGRSRPGGGRRGAGLHDVLTDRATLSAAVEETGPLAVLPADRRLVGARAADLDALESVLDRLERRYGRVVVDCPPGLATDVGYRLYCADTSVLVTTPDRAALSAALRTGALARDVEAPVVAAVLNAASGPEAGRVADRLERQVGAPTVVLDRSGPLQRAGTTPVRTVAPDSPATEAFADLAGVVEASKRGVRDRLDTK